MSVINTNISALIGLNNLRNTGLGLQTSLERLSSGLRINKGADDPSGLAIAKHMEAQINGIRMATQNGEDGINLIHTADGSLAETHDILMRMRDITVRAANQATLTSGDLTRLNKEFVALTAELQRKSQAVTFNNKVLFSGGFSAGQVLQIGPDNGLNHRLTIYIGAMTLTGLNLVSSPATVNETWGGQTLTLPDGTTINNVIGFASGVAGSYTIADSISYAMKAIDAVNSAINIVSDARAFLGIQERRIGHIIDDLKAEDINISAAKSRIWDADMATEISDFTRLQILQQSGTAILAQANAQPQSVLQLLK